MRYTAFFVGEFLGTFILVFFGCGSVAVTVLFSAHTGLFQVALLWGLSVTLAIYATRHLSCAHLNPAVSIAMVIGNRMLLRKLPVYICAQLSGAFLAASVLYLLFSASITQFELNNAIVRGSAESIQTAMIFGEFYPNPGSGSNVVVSMTTAALAEAVGTFALVFFIFAITEGCNLGRPNDILAPIFIGLALAVIISIIAPLTQAGLNPARDFAPRMFAFLAGWGRAALPDDNYGFLVVYILAPVAGFLVVYILAPVAGFLVVYILAPVAGGSAASLFFTKFLEPLMVKKSCKCA